jgi:hypothetical protein
MTPTSRKSIPTCCSTSPLPNSIFFNATNQISAQNRQPGLKPGTMHADELVISEHAAPPGTSSNDINGFRFRNATHPPLHSAAQRLRAGAEKWPELLPILEVGNAPAKSPQQQHHAPARSRAHCIGLTVHLRAQAVCSIGLQKDLPDYSPLHTPRFLVRRIRNQATR